MLTSCISHICVMFGLSFLLIVETKFSFLFGSCTAEVPLRSVKLGQVLFTVSLKGTMLMIRSL